MSGSRDQFLCTVQANLALCREHFRLMLSLPTFPPTQPGQFIQVACRDASSHESGEREVEWSPGLVLGDGPDLRSPLAMLRRPFSLAGRRDARGGVELEIIHRVVGVGTDWLSRLAPGDTVSILGPLGNHFSLPSPGQQAILVGGGVGIPPMLYLADALGATTASRATGAGPRAVAFAGATTRELLPLTIVDSDADPLAPAPRIEEFARRGVDAVITTDDGTYGFQGFVTQALERYLDAPAREQKSPRPIIYTCGPELMMKRVAAIAAEREIECQVAVERAMACGMGTCQSCCIKVRKPDPSKPPLPGSDWCYRLACTDGPVFLGRDLLW